MSGSIFGLDGRSPPGVGQPRREVMVEPEAVAALLRLRALGWGSRRIARELGISRGTVKRYVEAGGWQPFKQPRRSKVLDGLDDWLRERFHRHRGNADVVRQALAAEKGIVASLRTVQRAVEPYRQELLAEARATVRFETAPGRQLQIDFGCPPRAAGRSGTPGRAVGRDRRAQGRGVPVRRDARLLAPAARAGVSPRAAGELVRRHGHPTRAGSRGDPGMESAFLSFGGVTEELLLDPRPGSWARALVTEHDAETRTVVFNAKLLAFARHWGFRPRACAPYRARTKGKAAPPPHASRPAWGPRGGRRLCEAERHQRPQLCRLGGVRGRGPQAILIAWGGEAHLAAWERDIANARVHGTTGEVPMVRFARDEAAALQPLADRHHFGPAGHWSGGSRTTVPSRSTATPIRSPSAVC